MLNLETILYEKRKKEREREYVVTVILKSLRILRLRNGGIRYIGMSVVTASDKHRVDIVIFSILSSLVATKMTR